MKAPRCFAILVLSTFTLVVASGVVASASGSREATEIKAGWRFQVDSHDIGERERWYDAGFDRSGWRGVEVPRAWDVFDEALRATKESAGTASSSTVHGPARARSST